MAQKIKFLKIIHINNLVISLKTNDKQVSSMPRRLLTILKSLTQYTITADPAPAASLHIGSIE